MKTLRYGLILLGLLMITGLFTSQIKALEAIKSGGDTLLLDLRPVDPRAFMMGDFMALRYAEERPQGLPKDIPPQGSFVLKKDENNVGRFVRVDNATPLLESEIKINYTRQIWGVNFGAPRYYFENGTAQSYEPARYGIFKVNASGRAILTGLADKEFKVIDADTEAK